MLLLFRAKMRKIQVVRETPGAEVRGSDTRAARKHPVVGWCS
jgi:hypothetical protein